MCGRPFARYLTDNGQLSGNIDIQGDFTSAPQPWFFLSEPDHRYEIHTLTVTITASPPNPFYRMGYGNSVTGINGALTLRTSDSASAGIPRFILPTVIKTIPDWHDAGARAPEITQHLLDQIPTVRLVLSLTQVLGAPIRLDGRLQETFELFVDGDVNLGLLHHRVCIFGQVF